MMTPTNRYEQDLAAGIIVPDEQQRQVIARLTALHQALTDRLRQRASLPRRFMAMLGLSGSESASVRGIYLWGGVGRGKTYLMDLFFDCVSTPRKRRTHFHRFMQQVHQQLARLQGSKNPLELVAAGIAEETDLLCFDEFFVLDIGDAMILAGLLEALFARHVSLVATSNIHPDDLYENGLQRQRFLPAIDLIKRYTEVVELGGGTDFRLRSLSQATLYHYPVNADTAHKLQQCFLELAPDRLDMAENTRLDILGREIACRYCAGDVAWFEFAALCDGPRSAYDYVEIARLFHAVILSDVPALDDRQGERARRFVHLVDELYDRRVKLIIAAAVPLPELYRGEALAFEFKRTESRLIEMQSHAYLGSTHRA